MIRIDLVLLFLLMNSINRLNSSIEIRRFSIEQRQQVINLLLGSFFLEEPLNNALKFEIPREPLPWIEHVVDQALKERCSFVAIDENSNSNEVVAVIINGIRRRQQIEENFPIDSEKLKFIFSITNDVLSKVNMFDRFQTDRLFEIEIINVGSDQRGQNLSSALINHSIEHAQQLGIRAAFVLCTSFFSRRAFQRQAFQTINEIPYSNYGIIINNDIHDRCSLLARCFSNKTTN